MGQFICQWLAVASLTLAFFRMVNTDINGRDAIKPKGYEGFVTSVIAVAVSAFLYYGAGAFTNLFEWPF